MRHQSRSIDELTVNSIIGGESAFGKKVYLNAGTALGTDGHAGTSPNDAVKTLAAAWAKIESLKNHAIILSESASAISLASAFTWDKSVCSLIGTSRSRSYQRSRIAQSTTALATLFTVSGYGNTFQNIRMVHGTASTTNKTLLKLTGAGNNFINMNFDCANTTTSGQSDFRMIHVAEDEQYFEDCVIGTYNTAQAAGTLVYVDVGTNSLHFKNCIFKMNASANAAFFMQFVGGIGEGCTIFENCKFINTGTTLTYAFDGTGLNNHIVFLDRNCSVYGATDWVAAAYEGYVIYGVGDATAATDDLLGLAIAVDTTP